MQKTFFALGILAMLAVAACRKKCADPDPQGTIVPAGAVNALSVGRSFMAAASLDNKAFFAGGTTYTWDAVTGRDTAIAHKTVDIYDGVTGQWSTATLSTARFTMAAAAAGNKVVFAGGQLQNGAASGAVDIYDVKTSTWTTATLSQPRYVLAAGAAGDYILFAGGRYDFGYSNTVDIYNVRTGVWSTDTLSKPRQFLAGAGAGNKILFAGGSDHEIRSVNTVDIYDVTTGKWTAATLSEPRILLKAITAGNKIIIAGGIATNHVASTIDVYDAVTGQWSTGHLTQGLYNFAGTLLGDKVLLAGGATWNTTDEISAIEFFQLSTNTSTTATFSLKEPAVGPAAVTVGNKTLVAGGYNFSTGPGGSHIFNNLATVNFFELK